MSFPRNIELTNISSQTHTDIDLDFKVGTTRLRADEEDKQAAHIPTTDSSDRLTNKLLDLVADGNYNGVINLVTSRNRPNINGCDESGETALHLAALRGDLLIANFLIDSGASLVARRFQSEFTPLDDAISAGRTDMVKLLLTKGAPLTPLGIPVQGPLPICVVAISAKEPLVLCSEMPKMSDQYRNQIRSEIEEKVQKLRSFYQDSTKVPRIPVEGRLGGRNMGEIFEILLRFGADPCQESSVKVSPIRQQRNGEQSSDTNRRALSLLLQSIRTKNNSLLDWCLDVAKVSALVGEMQQQPSESENSFSDLSQRLSEAMQNVLLEPTSPIDVINGKLRLPVHVAAWYNNTYALKRIGGLIPNSLVANDPATGLSPVHIAALADRPEAFSFCLERHFEPTQQPDSIGNMTTDEWVSWMCQNDPCLKEVPGGATLLHWIAAQGKSSSESVVNAQCPLLIETFTWASGRIVMTPFAKNRAIDALSGSSSSTTEESSIIMIILKRLDSCFSNFIEKRRERHDDTPHEFRLNPVLSVKDSKGRTPLHWAVSDSNAHSVYALLRFGASMDEKDKEGTTPWSLSQEMSGKYLPQFLSWYNKAMNESMLKFNHFRSVFRTEKDSAQLADESKIETPPIEAYNKNLFDIALPSDSFLHNTLEKTSTPLQSTLSLVRSDWDFFELDAPMVGAFVRNSRGVPRPDTDLLERWKSQRLSQSEKLQKEEEAKWSWTKKLSYKLGFGVGLTQESRDRLEDEVALVEWLTPSRYYNPDFSPSIPVLLLFENRKRLELKRDKLKSEDTATQ